MNSGLLQTLVQEDFGYEKEGHNWGRAEQHSSLVVNEEAQRWYWNSENLGGGVLEYLINVRGLSKKSAEEAVKIQSKLFLNVREDEEVKSQRPYEKLVDLLWELGKGNREYWYKRKLTDKTIDRYRLGFYNGWNLVPLYLKDKLINFQCRRDKPEKKIRLWYREQKWQPVLINAEILNFVDIAYIVEGTVDAILLNQEGMPAVAQTSGAVHWSPEWFSLFSRVNKIYYIADNDTAGILAAKRAAKSLGEDKVLIYQFEGKPEKYDTIDYFRDGGTAEEFKKIVESNSKNIFEIGELSEYRTGHRRRPVPMARKPVQALYRI